MEIQSVIGFQAWTPSTGWFTWTQEMVNETIVQYEQTLREIQSGWKISKPIAEGDATIQPGYYGDTLAGSAETDRAIVSEPNEPTWDELFAEYANISAQIGA